MRPIAWKRALKELRAYGYSKIQHCSRLKRLRLPTASNVYVNLPRLARITCLTLSVSVFAAAQKVPQSPSQPTIPPQPGVLENTLTAEQLNVHEKFQLRVIETLSIRGLLGSAIGAGIAQLSGTPYEWGGGAEGYGRRYGSSFGNAVSRQVFAFGLDSALHEDSRYFPSNETGFGPRVKNVIKQVLIAKRDDGTATFAYSRVISAFGAGQLVNTWQPRSTNSFGDGLERGAFSLAGDLGYFAMQEFLPFTRNSAFRRHR